MSRTSLRSPFMTPACSAAPTATTSSGLTPLLGSLPPVSSVTTSDTAGMRVEPPTRTTWSMSFTEMPASRMTWWNGAFTRSSSDCVICWNCARVNLVSRWMGPFSLIERYCSEMLVLVADDSSFLACSAASRRRCSAILSFDRSTPVVFFTSVTRCATIAASQSSPPRRLSPAVARTSMVEKPSSSLPTSRRDTSNVPPPRSKTRMFSSSLPRSRP